jgi:hypothetical protein
MDRERQSVAKVALLRGTFTLRSGQTGSYSLVPVLDPVGDLQQFGARLSRKRSLRKNGQNQTGCREPDLDSTGDREASETGLPRVFVRNKNGSGMATPLEDPPSPGVVIVKEPATTAAGRSGRGGAGDREQGEAVGPVILVILFLTLIGRLAVMLVHDPEDEQGE